MGGRHYAVKRTQKPVLSRTTLAQVQASVVSLQQEVAALRKAVTVLQQFQAQHAVPVPPA